MVLYKYFFTNSLNNITKATLRLVIESGNVTILLTGVYALTFTSKINKFVLNLPM